MDTLPSFQTLEEGVISESLLRALTLGSLRGLCACDRRLARLLAGSGCWVQAAAAEVPFLRLEACCPLGEERAGLLRALRVLRRAVPARSLQALVGSVGQVEELGEAVRAAALASELHVRSRGGFAAPVVGRLRWADEAALLGALSTPGPKPDAFCLAAPVSLPQRESEQLAGLLGLTGALGPPLPMRVVLAWRAGRLMAAVSRGGLVPERLRLPDPEGCGPATKLVVRVTLRCLDPDLPLPEVSLSIPVGRQWVAVPLELPAAEGARAAATAAMVRGALCVLTFAAAAEPEGWRLGLAVNSLQLHAPRGGGGEA